MEQDADKIIKEVIKQNPGIPIKEKIYVEMHNKIPGQKGTLQYISLEQKPRNNTNSIAIRTDKANYLCIDFDGTSNKDKQTKEYKQEKQQTAEKIKDNYIQLLNQQTSKYRLDRTASNKYHTWHKQPNVPNKEFLKLPKFYTKDGALVTNDIVEVIGTFDKKNIHLAGSTITENNQVIGTYENIYAGASFDELDAVDNIIGLLISAITSAGYIVKLEKAEKKTNIIKFRFNDATHKGVIRQYYRKEQYYFSYLIDDITVDGGFYTVSKNDFSIDHIMQNCKDEFKSILCSIYYYHKNNTDTKNKESMAIVENQETSRQIIEVYKKHWSNTPGKRHYLLLATSHILVKYLNFNESDLLNFFDELADSVDEIDYAHRNVIIEGLKPASKKYGIPTIIDILQCDKQELQFLAKSSDEINNELEYIERIKPTLTAEIIEDEMKFNKLQELQRVGYYDGINTYIKIKPTNSVTSLITSILSNSLYKEKDNISKLLLALIGVVIGTTKTYIIVSGTSNAGKSALIKAVKQVIPSVNTSQVDELSDQAFLKHTEDKGKYVYDRMIIDYGDKGNIKGYEKAIEEMARFQNLITEDNYSRRVSNTDNNNSSGTKLLEVSADGFALMITTVKEVLAKIDEQLITRSEIIYVGNNSKKEIADFNARLGTKNKKRQVKAITKLIQSHILYNLDKFNDAKHIIINEHWHQYIKDILVANGGVQREIEATLNAFQSYCWIEINRLHTVKGTDNKKYYIPASNIVDEFMSLYGVKSNKDNKIDKELIDVINTKYEPIDGDLIYDGYDLSNKEKREEFQVFTYQDIESLLKKDENIELYNKINNISDVLRKLEKSNILARLPDKAKNNVVYYIKSKSLSIDKELEIKPIDDDDIKYAIEHLQNHEAITDDNDEDAIIFGKNRRKFIDNTDFSFIDQRDIAPGTVENINNNDDDDDDDDDDGAGGVDGLENNNIPGNKSTAKTSTHTPGNNKNSNDNTSAGEYTTVTNARNISIDEHTITDNLVNLHCHTDESVGDGATSIEKLINTAIEHNQKAIAITNHGTLNGTYKFNNICRQKGIKPILGIEAYINKERYHLTLLAMNKQGYNDLLKLHNKNVQYMKDNKLNRNDKFVNGGIYYTNLEKDKELCNNIIALSGCISGQIPQLLLAGEYKQAKQLAITYNTIFNKFYLEIQYNGLLIQEQLNDLLIELSNDTGIPLTVTGDVHYIDNKDDWNAIKSAHRKNSKAPASNNSFLTRAPKQLAETTIEIADSIETYNIDTSLHIPKPKHNREWLRTYCYERLKQLGIDDNEHIQRLEQELSVIKDEIADYHILLYEIVETIKPVAGAIGGRGSAVGSLVCYLLGFHEVDPLQYNLLFERFLNAERIEKAIQADAVDTSLLPDIDLNIADDKKDAVYAILETEYEHIAKVMTYSKLKADNKTIKTIKEKYPTADVIDLKYNLSVHAGGIVLSTEPFNQYLPVTLTKDNEIVSDCSLEEIEARGGIKYDLLGESSSKINQDIKLEDQEINQLVKFIVEHPIGISQFTGYSARKYLQEHTIKNFNDLLNATALIRTGSNESWIFQEDMMQEATKYNITMADADYIRKPRGNQQEKQEKLEKIIETMKANGCTEKDATLFKEYHNNYSFNKSHAVAYTLESLKNAKLKKEHTAVFFERKLNHSKDPISIAELFDDAIKLGVEIIPPDRHYYELNATARGNKLWVGTKFIKGISSKTPLNKGKINKTYRNYLNQSHQEQLYSLGAYDKDELPGNPICLGYKTMKDKIIVATISKERGLFNMWFEKSSQYKPTELFNKGSVITDEIIDAYASIL